MNNMKKIHLSIFILGLVLIAGSSPWLAFADAVTKEDLSASKESFSQAKSVFEEMESGSSSEEELIVQGKEVLASGSEVFSASLTFHRQGIESLTKVDEDLRSLHLNYISEVESWVGEKQTEIDQVQTKEELQIIAGQLSEKWKDLRDQAAIGRSELLLSKIRLVIVNIEDASRLINDSNDILLSHNKTSDQAQDSIRDLDLALEEAQNSYDQAALTITQMKDAENPYQEFSGAIINLRETSSKVREAKDKVSPAVEAVSKLILGQ